MRRSIQELLNDLERHGVRLLAGGWLQPTGDAPASLLMRAHRNRRALMAASRGQRAGSPPFDGTAS